MIEPSDRRVGDELYQVAEVITPRIHGEVGAGREVVQDEADVPGDRPFREEITAPVGIDRLVNVPLPARTAATSPCLC